MNEALLILPAFPLPVHNGLLSLKFVTVLDCEHVK